MKHKSVRNKDQSKKPKSKKDSLLSYRSFIIASVIRVVGVVGVSLFSISQSIPPQNKPFSVSSVNLTDQQGTPLYETQGIQNRKFLGLIPVKANVQEQINAQTGPVVNIDLPWYYSLFGFAFQST